MAWVSEYNRQGKPRTLVGNWYEEQSLQETTGHARLPDQRGRKTDAKTTTLRTMTATESNQDARDHFVSMAGSSFRPADEKAYKQIAHTPSDQAKLLPPRLQKKVEAELRRKAEEETLREQNAGKVEEDDRFAEVSAARNTYRQGPTIEVPEEDLQRFALYGDTPINVHSSSGMEYGLTAKKGANPFGKSSNFSQHNQDYCPPKREYPVRQNQDDN